MPIVENDRTLFVNEIKVESPEIVDFSDQNRIEVLMIVDKAEMPPTIDKSEQDSDAIIKIEDSVLTKENKKQSVVPLNKSKATKTLRKGVKTRAISTKWSTDSKFCCKICKKNCYTENLVTIDDKQMLNCKICSAKFDLKTYYSFYRHYHQHLKPKEIINTKWSMDSKFCCKICKKNCYIESLVTVDGKQMLNCKICSIKFDLSTYYSFYRHYHRHLKPKAFPCKQCPFSAKFPGALTYHIKRVHENHDYFNCDVCDAILRSRRSLEHHVQNAHLNMRFYKCTICNEKSFYNKYALQEHVDSDHKGVRYTCAVCKNEYKNKSYLNRHMREAHDPNHKRKKHKCPICPDREFHRAISLKTHIKQHAGKQDWVCEVCGKSFYTLNSLSLHRTIHETDFKFSCEFCSKKFRNRNFLTTHIRTHTGEKPFECKQCKKRFTQRSTLTVHLRYHSGERPYACNLCSKMFVTKTLMSSHKRKIHNVYEGGVDDSKLNKQ